MNNSTAGNPHGGHTRSADALFVDTIMGVITTLVFSAAFTENLILIVIIIKMVPLHNKPIQSLILSLATADFLQSICQQLPYAIDKLHHTWLMGGLVCKLYCVGRSVFGPTSLFIIAFIGVERYRSLQKSDGIAFSLRTTRIIIALAWMACMAGALPQAAWFAVVVYPGGTARCSYTSGYSSTVKVYTIVTRIGYFLFPTAVVWVSYLGVVYRIMKSSRKVMHMNANSASGVKRQQTVIRVSRTCVFTALVYTLCNSPFNISLLHAILSNGRNVEALTYTWIFTAISACINPIIYGLTLRSFREALLKLLSCNTRRFSSDQTATRTRDEDNSGTTKNKKNQWATSGKLQDGAKVLDPFPSNTTQMEVITNIDDDDKVPITQPNSNVKSFNAF